MHISAQTIWNRLSKGGKRAWHLEVGTRADTPGLCHPREQQTWQICHWLPGLFTDDSRFTLGTHDRRERVWRLCGEWFGACYSFQCARFGDGWMRSRHILGGLHRSQCASQSSDLRLVQWALGSFCPMMWLEYIIPGWWRNYYCWLTCPFSRPDSNRAPLGYHQCHQVTLETIQEVYDAPSRSESSEKGK